LRLAVAILTLILAAGAAAQESFPGQNNLAAGLTCYRNLDMACARARLEEALALFSPEKDPNYLQHIREARLILAMIHVAADELQKAENEFKKLLLVDPVFELPAGEHPPKVIYVFKRAKAAMMPPVVEKKPPEKKRDPPPPPKKPEKRVDEKAPPTPLWSLSTETRLVALFGDDANAVTSGPGASLAFGIRPADWICLRLDFAYAYHPNSGDGPALQAMTLSTGAYLPFDFLPVQIRIGGLLGALAMGTRDRYDHWGFSIGLLSALAWPAEGSWSLLVSLYPSVVFASGESSFYLPVGFSGELRW
jgi:hypothetical protein